MIEVVSLHNRNEYRHDHSYTECHYSEALYLTVDMIMKWKEGRAALEIGLHPF